LVGLVRFELTTSCTPCKRATRLRYSPSKGIAVKPRPRGDVNPTNGGGLDRRAPRG
jgi:hypothetical protein